MSAAKDEQDKKKGGIKIAGIAAVTIVIVGLVGVIIYLLNQREPNSETASTEQERRNVVVTPENVDEVIQQMNESQQIEPGYYLVSMNYDWYFKTGDAISSNATVRNSTENTNAVFFDVVMADDEEDVIYKSPVIPVGSSLKQISLDRKLDAGTYDCIVIYHLIDDEQNTLSTLRVTVTIIVEE